MNISTQEFVILEWDEEDETIPTEQAINHKNHMRRKQIKQQKKLEQQQTMTNNVLHSQRASIPHTPGLYRVFIDYLILRLYTFE